MTKEQKIDWLKNVNNENLLNQFRWTVTQMSMGGLQQRLEAQEDYELAIAEILKRMN